PETEQQADREIAAIQQKTLPHLDLMLFPMQHTQIEREDSQNDGEEQQPLPGGSAEEGIGQKRNQRLHRALLSKFEQNYDSDITVGPTAARGARRHSVRMIFLRPRFDKGTKTNRNQAQMRPEG